METPAPTKRANATAAPPMRGVALTCTLRSPPSVSSSARGSLRIFMSARVPAHAKPPASAPAKNKTTPAIRPPGPVLILGLSLLLDRDAPLGCVPPVVTRRLADDSPHYPRGVQTLPIVTLPPLA